MHHRPWFPLICFVLLALLLRWGTSFISVINHDESTYLVIAREMLNGKVYLRDIFDTKPIGVFWLYMALIKLTGGSLPAIRLVTHLSVAVTAWACYLAARRATANRRVGWAAGSAYVFATSLYSDYGIGPNSELFFNTLTSLAVVLAVAPRVGAPEDHHPRWPLPVAGLLLGCAVIIKPFAVAESFGIGLFLTWFYVFRRRQPGRGIGAGLLLIGGFSLPLLAVYGYYAAHGLVENLVFYNFTVNRRYPVDLAWYLRLKFLGDYLLRYAMLTVPAIVVLLAAFRRGVNRTWSAFLLGYFVLVAIMILTPGRRFGYYQVQLHPALCLLAAGFLDPRVGIGARVREALNRRTTVIVLLVVAAGLGVLHYVRYANKPDRPALLQAYFRDRLEPEEQFFSITSHQISYYLLDREVPTPFVHTALMFYPQYVEAYGLDEEEEAERLLANPRLRYLVRHPGDRQFFTPLTERLFQEFTLVDSLDSELYIYRRKD